MASGSVVLVLADVGDPLRRYHGIDRDADYRLKLALKGLLRGHGFRCVRCCDGERVEVVTSPAAPDPVPEC